MKVQLTKKNVILNDVRGKNQQILNTLILNLKRFIYVQKCNQKQLNFQGFIKQMYNLKRVEGLIAARNDKLKIHLMKWKKIV